ncbi:MAG TPA: hypothetical protein VNB64_02590 [Solirubrobacteraceae bacterium]|nr:hypothetical protein [Solirubrobacteraceae bacterium]
MRRLTVVVLAILTLGALLWIGGELHYRNCIDAAKAEVSTAPGADGWGRSGSGGWTLGDASGDAAQERSDRVQGCSRIP